MAVQECEPEHQSANDYSLDTEGDGEIVRVQESGVLELIGSEEFELHKVRAIKRPVGRATCLQARKLLKQPKEHIRSLWRAI